MCVCVRYVFTTSSGDGVVTGATFQWLHVRHDEALMLEDEADSRALQDDLQRMQAQAIAKAKSLPFSPAPQPSREPSQMGANPPRVPVSGKSERRGARTSSSQPSARGSAQSSARGMKGSSSQRVLSSRRGVSPARTPKGGDKDRPPRGV